MKEIYWEKIYSLMYIYIVIKMFCGSYFIFKMSPDPQYIFREFVLYLSSSFW